MDRPELQRAEPGRVRLGASGLALVALIAIVVAVVGASAGSTRTLSSPSPRSAPTPTSDRSVAAAMSTSAVSATPAPSDPRPAWVDNLAGQLQCDRSGPTSQGNEVMPGRMPMEPAPDPAASLDHALLAYVSIPVRGYLPIEVVGDWARYRYFVDGRLKAVAVLTDQFDGYPDVKGWDLVGLRACDGSEMRQGDIPAHGITIWRDRLDQPVVTTTISSIPGPGHCGWESAIFLWYRGEQFFRDPRHVLRGSTVVSFDPTVHLPDDASDTGLHTDRWHLFEIPSGRAVFMRTAGGTVERWPHAKQEVGCI